MKEFRITSYITIFLAFFFSTSLFGSICYPHYFYLGVESGCGWNVGRDHICREVGSNVGILHGVAKGKANFGSVFGAEFGCRFDRQLRADLSFTLLHNNYPWLTTFTTPQTRKSSCLDSHLILLNGYYHFGCWLRLNPCFDPYIGAGIGLAVNHLHRIFEKATQLQGPNFPGRFIAIIDSRYNRNFGARLSSGILFHIHKRFLLDAALSLNYIGAIRTGKSRRLETGLLAPVTVPISPYIFRHNLLATMTLGLKALF